MDRGILGDVWVGILGFAAVALCCGGPLLLAALATGGLGAWLASHGALITGVVAILIATAAGAVAIRHRSA